MFYSALRRRVLRQTLAARRRNIAWRAGTSTTTLNSSSDRRATVAIVGEVPYSEKIKSTMVCTARF
jgi:hypothetical protein